jgi:hypothetical protein
LYPSLIRPDKYPAPVSVSIPFLTIRIRSRIRFKYIRVGYKMSYYPSVSARFHPLPKSPETAETAAEPPRPLLPIAVGRTATPWPVDRGGRCGWWTGGVVACGGGDIPARHGRRAVETEDTEAEQWAPPIPFFRFARPHARAPAAGRTAIPDSCPSFLACFLPLPSVPSSPPPPPPRGIFIPLSPVSSSPTHPLATPRHASPPTPSR